MTSDGRGVQPNLFCLIGVTNKTSDEGGGGVKKGSKSSDVINGLPLGYNVLRYGFLV